MLEVRHLEQHRVQGARPLTGLAAGSPRAARAAWESRFLLPACAALLAACLSCESEPEIVEKVEAEAEGLFARKAVVSVIETRDLEGLVSDWMDAPVLVSEACSGPSVVKGLKGTGDKGEAYNRAIEIFLEVVESAKEMPVEGDIAAVIVEWDGKSDAKVKPMWTGAVLEGGDLAMTCLRDRRGDVRAAALGRVEKSGSNAWTVKVLPRQTAAREFAIRPKYAWPDAGKAVFGGIKQSKAGSKAALDPDGSIRLAGDEKSTVESVAKELGKKSFSGRVEDPRIIVDPIAGAITIYGEGVCLDASNIRLGSGVRVVSGGSANNFAVVEIQQKNRTCRIQTTRMIRDIVRVLDRMAVDLAEIGRILKWAYESKALAVEPVFKEPSKPWPGLESDTLK